MIGFEKFHDDVFKHQKQLVEQINSMRVTLDLKKMKEEVGKLDKSKEETKMLLKQFEDLIQNGQSFLLQDLKIDKANTAQLVY